MRRDEIEQRTPHGQNHRYDLAFGALRRAQEALREAEVHARRAELSATQRRDVNTAVSLVAADVERVRQEQLGRSQRRAQEIVRRARHDRGSSTRKR